MEVFSANEVSSVLEFHGWSKQKLQDRVAKSTREAVFGFAFGGGGEFGALYNCATTIVLFRTIEGLNHSNTRLFQGVSSGSFFAHVLAQGFTLYDLTKLFMGADGPFGRISDFTRVDFVHGLEDVLSRGVDTLVTSANDLLNLQFLRAAQNFTNPVNYLPTGYYDPRAIERKIAEFIEEYHLPDRFDLLEKKTGKRLQIISSLFEEGGDAEVWGVRDTARARIPKMIAASCAIPIFFRHYDFEGEARVDGVLSKTVNASAALDHNPEVNVLICTNPITPYRRDKNHLDNNHRNNQKASQFKWDFSRNLEQTFRILIESRLSAGMRLYDVDPSYNASRDIWLFKPVVKNPHVLLSGFLGIDHKEELLEYFYQAVVQLVKELSAELEKVIRPYKNLSIDYGFLDDPGHYDTYLPII